jgi:anti-anti-sigma factor
MSIAFNVFRPSDRMLSAATSPDLLYWVGANLEAGINHLVIDLQEVMFMDSSGLGALVIARNRVVKVGGELSLCSLNGQARMLFDMAGVSDMFSLHDNLNAFKRAMALLEGV